MESLIKMDKSKKCYNLGAKSATTLLIFFFGKNHSPFTRTNLPVDG